MIVFILGFSALFTLLTKLVLLDLTLLKSSLSQSFNNKVGDIDIPAEIKPALDNMIRPNIDKIFEMANANIQLSTEQEDLLRTFFGDLLNPGAPNPSFVDLMKSFVGIDNTEDEVSTSDIFLRLYEMLGSSGVSTVTTVGLQVKT